MSLREENTVVEDESEARCSPPARRESVGAVFGSSNLGECE